MKIHSTRGASSQYTYTRNSTSIYIKKTGQEPKVDSVHTHGFQVQYTKKSVQEPKVDPVHTRIQVQYTKKRITARTKARSGITNRINRKKSLER